MAYNSHTRIDQSKSLSEPTTLLIVKDFDNKVIVRNVVCGDNLKTIIG